MENYNVLLQQILETQQDICSLKIYSYLLQELPTSLKELSEPVQQAVQLRYIKNKKVKEIAAHLNYSESTIRTYLHQSMHHLKMKLNKSYRQKIDSVKQSVLLSI